MQPRHLLVCGMGLALIPAAASAAPKPPAKSITFGAKPTTIV